MNKERLQELENWTKALGFYAGASEEETLDFWSRLSDDAEILEEYDWFYEHQSFACKVKIEGVSVVDLLVWQIDHFKAQLDRDSATRTNKDLMVFLAFDTFLRMRKNPESVLAAMGGQTGTDYPGKY